MSSRKYLFLNNASSGKKKSDRNAVIANFFENKDHKCEILEIDFEAPLEKTIGIVGKKNPDVLVAVGGDGTVNFTAQIASAMKLPMGILPAGSANGMAKELDIPNKHENALQAMIDGKPEKTDAVLINDDRICLHLSDVGMNAQLIKYFEDKGIRGKTGYARVVIKTLMNKQMIRVKLHNGQKGSITKDALMITIANAGKFGSGATINPLSDLNDGLFELIVVKKLSIRAVMHMFLRGGKFNPKDVEVYQTDNVEISPKRAAHFQVDGEYLGKTKFVKAEILKSYVDIICPAGG